MVKVLKNKWLSSIIVGSIFSSLTNQLIEALRCLPGIGPKSAQRLAFHLLATSGQAKGLALAETLQLAIKKIDYCKLCRIYTENKVCQLCENTKRDHALLCALESPADVIAIEHTSSYNGLYYVLHGHLSPLDGIGPAEIGIPNLLARLQTGQVEELIIATNPTMEGKATAHYIATHTDQDKIQCTRIAHGVPLGGELEYLDGSTLAHAFRSRTLIEEYAPK